METNKKEFKKNEVVEKNAQNFDVKTLNLPEECYLQEKLVTQAFKKISELWNKNERTRGFIFMLIKSFCTSTKSISFNNDEPVKDCILNIDACSLDELNRYAKEVIEEKTLFAANNIPFEKFKEHLENEILPKYSEGCKRSVVLVCSNKCSNKFLSHESHWALMNFINKNKLGYINGWDLKPRFNFTKKKQKTEVTRNSGQIICNFLSDDTLSKLKSIGDGNK